MVAVRALKGTIKAFANATAKMAKQDKKFAEELVYNHGIRGEITPKAIKQLTKDMFDSAGKLTSAGKKELNGLISYHKLSKNATWDEILQKVVEATRKFAVKIPHIKF